MPSSNQGSRPFLQRLLSCGMPCQENCIKDHHWFRRNLAIHLGEHDLRKQDDGEQNTKAVQLIRHPEFEPTSLKNDIMLLQLDPPAILGDTAKTIPLTKDCAPTGTKCVVSGWGATTFPTVNYAYVLQCLDSTILSKDICKSTYGTYFSDHQICAGLMEEGKDSCQGDSGSPLVCNGTLHGLVSWGAEKCASKKSPAIYTEICKFRKWIDDTMAANNKNSTSKG
ncbi:cationic trypsin-3-like isoform X2 [Rhineura floridana]|uniref:cationic trypsin-3-like isoform X2 n=1 Tax=Rhineura floridana TaxID=261503 RepID=UPI002AC8488C|nr:cationic trypsin-3-like isoform X2 [Rhineura floridana]